MILSQLEIVARTQQKGINLKDQNWDQKSFMLNHHIPMFDISGLHQSKQNKHQLVKALDCSCMLYQFERQSIHKQFIWRRRIDLCK
jgi:hypothetical protein